MLLPSPPQTPGGVSVPFGGAIQNQALNPAYGTTPYPVNPMLQAAAAMNGFVQQVVQNKRQEQDYYKQKAFDGLAQIQAGIPLDHKQVLKWFKLAGIPLQTEEPLAMPVQAQPMGAPQEQGGAAPAPGMPAVAMPGATPPPGVNATPAAGGIAAPLEQQNFLQKLGLQTYDPKVSVNSPAGAFLAQVQHQAQLDAASKLVKTQLDLHMGNQRERILNLIDEVMDPARTTPEKKNTAAELKAIELTGWDNLEMLAVQRSHNPDAAMRNVANTILMKDQIAAKQKMVAENWKQFVDPKTGMGNPERADRYFSAQMFMPAGPERDKILQAYAPTRSFEEALKMGEAQNKMIEQFPGAPLTMVPSLTYASMHPEDPNSQRILDFANTTFKSAARMKFENEAKRIGIDQSNLYLRQREFESNLWVNANRLSQEAAKALRSTIGEKFDNAWRLYQMKGVEKETRNAAMRDMADALNKQNSISFSAPQMKRDERGNVTGVELGQPIVTKGSDWTVQNVESIFTWLGGTPDQVIAARNAGPNKTWPVKAIESLAGPAKYLGGVTSATEFHKFLVKMYPEIDKMPGTMRDQIVKQMHEVFTREFWMTGQPEI